MLLLSSNTQRKTHIIVPCHNEQGFIGETVSTLREALPDAGILVVDDFSSDKSSEEANLAGAAVCRLAKHMGKGTALSEGLSLLPSDCQYVLFIDADIRKSAGEAVKLLEPIIADVADMTIGILPNPKTKSGFGFVVKLAKSGIQSSTGRSMLAPLSGQRAIKREALHSIGDSFHKRFGVDVGLTLDILDAGLEVVEVETKFSHRVTGRDLKSIWHRTKQFRDVALTLIRHAYRSFLQAKKNTHS